MIKGVTRSKRCWDKYQAEVADYYNRTDLSHHESWTAPFAPWCGSKWWDEKGDSCQYPRILFVGKSIGALPSKRKKKGHDEGSLRYWQTSLAEWRQRQSKESPLKQTETYVHDRLQRFEPGTHSFWTTSLLLATGLLPPAIEPDDIFSYIAWTNYYKVTCNNDVPNPGGCTHDKDDSCISCTSREWLFREITILKPDVIVLSLGDIWKKRVACSLRMAEKATAELPLNITKELNTLPPIAAMSEIEKPKSVWVTQHFTYPQFACRHGLLPLRIKKQLAAADRAGLGNQDGHAPGTRDGYIEPE